MFALKIKILNCFRLSNLTRFVDCVNTPLTTSNLDYKTFFTAVINRIVATLVYFTIFAGNARSLSIKWSLIWDCTVIDTQILNLGGNE
jgi:hypothetical protein